MGHIYKITNTINNKVYVGQTVKPVEKRFQQHRNNYTKEYFSQIVLYKAFKKYGVENFSFEEIEEVENSLLDEREKYWISYYNSYKDGYNSTLGGRLVELYNFDEEEIIECYMELKSARKVAKEYGVDHSTIDNILNVNNINRFTVKKKTKINKGGMEIEFDSVIDAARYFIETGVSKAKNPRVLFPHLLKVYQNNKTYFGWTVEIEQE